MGYSKSFLGAIVWSVAVVLGGCYVIPAGPDGRPVTIVPIPANPNVMQGGSVPSGVAAATPSGPASTVIAARLYPTNATASQTGLLSGTVTNYLNGRGEFQFNYSGEVLIGEATRTENDARRGVANAYGSRGTSLNCQYQMNRPSQGVGTCTMSNGATYQLHIGS
ncbi:MAG: hypothetical protein ACKVQT_12450 [Burkholderiales bacterium]